MTWHFATYFDSHYAAKGLTMLRSLRRHQPSAELTVLCLDADVERILRAVAPSARLIGLARLVDAEPRLAALRAQRKTWEFYATAKAVYLHRLLEALALDDVLAYVDADTCFHAAPLPAFAAELDAHSIVVSPHRYSPGAAHLSVYGPFNAGFGLWRADATARECLRDWAEACIAWCHETVMADGRFMNQGYLAAWPDRYAGVRIAGHPGINLAPWNVTAHTLQDSPDGLRVDGWPVVFFHFSNLARSHDGEWRTYDIADSLRHPLVMERLYVPYIAELEATRQYLLAHFGMEGTATVR